MAPFFAHGKHSMWLLVLSAIGIPWLTSAALQTGVLPHRYIKVQTVTTSTYTGANEVQTVTTSAADVNEIQIVTTSATMIREVQVVTTTAAPGQTLGGAFTLQLDTTSTGGSVRLSGVIGFTAGASGDRSCMKEILNAMANIGPTGVFAVSRSGPDTQGGYAWSITFDASMGNVPQLSLQSSTLIGAGAAVAITTATPGNVISDGYFTLTFGGSTTSSIPRDASNAVVQAALEALPTVDALAVSRTGPDFQGGYVWTITFLSSFNAGDVPLLGIANTLVATGANAVVTVGTQGNQLGGFFTLIYNTVPTTQLASSATDTAVKAALELIPGIGTVKVVRSGPDYQLGYTWTISFLTLKGPVSALGFTTGTLTETRSDSVVSKAISVVRTRPGTTQAVQSIATTTTLTAVPIASTFQLQFTNNGVTTTTGNIPANPMGDGTCMPTLTEIQRIKTSTVDTTNMGGDNLVSPLTFFQLVFTSRGVTQTTNRILANPSAGNCTVGGASIKAELEKLPGVVAPVTVSNVATTSTQSCQWDVTFTNNAGNLNQLTAVSGTIGPASAITVGDDTVTITTVQDGTVQIIKSELEKLANVASVTVTAVAGLKQTCTWSVTFDNNAGNLALLQVAMGGVFGSAATSSGTTVTAALVTTGTSAPLGGFFSLQFRGQTTGYLPYNIAAADMKNALELLSTVDGVSVVRSNVDPNGGYSWAITFLNLGNLPPLTADFAALVGTVPTVTITETIPGIPPPFNSRDLANVTALNAIGRSVPQMSTPPFAIPVAQPPRAPQNLTMSVLGHTSLQVSLGFPTSDGGLPVDAYRVEWDTQQIVDEVQSVVLTVPVTNEVQTITTAAAIVSEVQLVRLVSTYVAPAAIEVQRVNCDASGGSFTLTFVGATTAPILASETSVAVIKATLQELAGVTVSVAFVGGATQACAPCLVSGCAGGIAVTFTSVVGYAGSLPSLTANTTLLTGNRRIDVVKTTSGQAAPGGMFSLVYNRGSDSVTVPIQATATAAAVQTALQALEAGLTITVTDGTSALPAANIAAGERLWRVTFVNSGDVPTLRLANNQLTGNGATIQVYADGATLGSVVASVRGNQVSGQFTLNVMGHVTDWIPYDASDTTVKQRLESLPNLGTVTVVRTGPTLQLGYVWTVTFSSNPGNFPYGAGTISLMTPTNTTFLTGTSTTATVTPARVTTGSTSVGGTFSLCYSSLCTSALSPYISATALKAALETVNSIGRVGVSRAQAASGFTWLVSFVGCRLLADQVTNVCNTGNLSPLVPQFIGTLTGGVANNAVVAVTEVTPGAGPANVRDLTDLSGGAPLLTNLLGLTTGRPYYARANFHNALGHGIRVYSTPPSVIPQATAPGKPEPVLLVSTTATSMQVSWALPTVNGGSVVTGYELWLSDWNDNYRMVYDGANSIVTTYTLVTTNDNEISTGQQYALKVRAISYCQPANPSVACFGSFSDPAKYTVRSPVIPSAPAAPTRDSKTNVGLPLVLGDGVIFLNWKPPLDNGGSPVTDYQVYMDSGAGFLLQTLTGVFPYGYTTSVGSLTEGNMYRFYVRALNAVGYSANSPILTVAMANSPNAPAAPIVTDVSPSSISLTWSPPLLCTSSQTSCNGSPLTGYFLWQFSGVNSALLSSPTPVLNEVQQIAITVQTPTTEVQSFTITGATGKFILNMNGKDTPLLDVAISNSLLATQIATTGLTVTVSQVAITNGITWTVSYTGTTGPVPLLVVEPEQLTSTNPLVAYSYSVTRVALGTTVAGGDFTLSFLGYETPHLAYNTPWVEMKRQLENLPSITHVAGAYTAGANGAGVWVVTFLTELGNVPLIGITSGRLTGGGTTGVVTSIQDGTPGRIVYDGSNSPDVLAYQATNLTSDTWYSYAVVAINTAGVGIASPTTPSIDARGGASSAMTTASGTALHVGIAGVVYEVQTVTTNGLGAGTFTLKFGSFVPTAPVSVATSADTLTSLLQATNLGTVSITKMAVNGAADSMWYITFRDYVGNAPLLVTSSAAVTAAEFIQGRANQFTIEPKKASGNVVTDLDAASGFVGSDTFFTELWSSPANVVDGTHAWVADGGVATYNPATFEIQSITITASTGLFTVKLDTSVARLGGVLSTSTVPLNAATLATASDLNAAFSFKGCVEALTNAGTVLVTRTTNSASSWTYAVTFVTSLGDIPPLMLVSTDATFTTPQAGVLTFTEVARGATEIQTVTAAGDTAFVQEVQSVSTWLDATGGVTTIGGTFAVSFAGAPPVTLSVSATTNQVQLALQSLTNLGTVTVTSQSANYGASTGLTTWFITFTTLVGDVPSLQITTKSLTGTSANVYVNEVIKGQSPLAGTFVLSFVDQTTLNLPYDISALQLKAELEKMPLISQVDVARTNLNVGFKWTISFTKNVGNLPLLQASPYQYQVQSVTTSGGSPTPLYGTFTLSFNGQESAPISYDANAKDVKAALESLTSIGRVDVTRSNLLSSGGQFQWLVTFRTELGPNALLVANFQRLSGSFPGVSVAEVQSGLLKALTGNNPVLTVEKKLRGTPSYTANYVPALPGSYSLAVTQLTPGGLNALYFDNFWLQDAPVQSQVDPRLQFQWGQSPITTFGQDYVSIRWWGKLKASFTDEYVFYLDASHGVRLWLDHSLVVDTWDDDNPSSTTVRFNLIANRYHDVRLEFHKATGSAYLSLQWSSTFVPIQVIPSTAFYRPSHIVGSPYLLNVIPGATDFPYTTATGDGLRSSTAGNVATFIIQSKDQRGNNKTVDGDVFDVQLTGTVGTTAKLTPFKTPEYLGQGQYLVSYKATVSGTYALSIQIGGSPIYCGLGAALKCSPFTVVVTSGKTVPYTSTATGANPPNMDSLVEMIAGQASNFTIQAKDTYANKREVGGDVFDTRIVLVADPTVRYRSSVLEYQATGLYNVQLSVPKAGVYTMATYFQNSPVLMCPGQVCSAIGSTSSLTVVHNVLHPPTSYATDTGTQGLSLATSNVPNSFSIYALDSFGNLRVGATTLRSTSTGDGRSDVFLVTIASPLDTVTTSSAVQVLTSPNSAQVGTFKLTYGSFSTLLCAACAQSLAGNVITVNVNLVGLIAVNTKFTVNACVLTPTAVTTTTITVNANHGCAGFTGAATSLYISATTPRLTALLPQNVNAAGIKYALELLDPLNRVQVSRTVNGAGNYVWSITFLSRLSSWSTAKLAVEYPANTASLYGFPLAVTTPASAGIYPVGYTMTVAGVYTMNITANGIHILGSPFTMTVQNAVVDGFSSVAAGGNWYSRALPTDYTQINAVETLPSTAGQTFSFLLQAKDARRNEVQVLRTRAAIVANVNTVQQILPQASSFTLSFRGSAPITVTTGTTYTALATALGAVATIGAGGVTVTAATGTTVTNGQAFVVTFTGLAGPLPYFVANANAIVSQITPGVTSFRQEIQTFTCVAATPATAGAFDVSYGSVANTVNVLATSTVSAFASQIQTLVGSPVTVTTESATTALCTAAGIRVFIQFTTAQGNLPALTYSPSTGATMTLTSEKDVGGALGGIAPLWGSFTLSYSGETTVALPFDVSATALASALNNLLSIDGVVVTKDVLDVSTEGGNSIPQITSLWAITFTQNSGNLALLAVDSSLLVASNSGQLQPSMDVVELVAGTIGNNRSDVSDLAAVAVTVQQNYVNPGLQEIQTLTCVGTSSFTLTYGGTTITVAPSLTLVQFKALLTPLVTGGVIVTSPGATAVCHPFTRFPITITFFTPLSVNLLAWGASTNEISIVRTQTGVPTVSSTKTISNYEQQTLVCTGTSATFDLVYGSNSVNVDAAMTIAQLSTLINGMPLIVALGGVTVTSSQATVCAATTPANVVIAFNVLGNPDSFTAQNFRAGIASVSIVESIRGLTSLTGLSKGQYQIVLTPTVSGLYTFSVTIGGRACMNPSRILVASGRSSGPHSTHNANAVATQGTPESLVIQARDAYLNPLSGSVELNSAGFIATLSLAGQKFPVSVSEASPNTDGTYTVAYLPRVFGNHTLSIRHRLSGGLLATYYSNDDYTLPEIYCVTQRLSTTPLCDGTRVEGPLTFAWGETQPPKLLNPSFPSKWFSVTWLGDVAVPVTDDYTFVVSADGDVMVQVDSTVLIQHIGNTTATTSGTLHLTAGAFYKLWIKYSAGALPKFALSWSTPSVPLAPIPASQLFFHRQIDRSPFSVSVYPGDMVATTSTSSYIANSTFFALSPVSFVVTSRDVESNVRVNYGRDLLDITVTGSGGWAGIGRVNDVTTNTPITIQPSLLCAACVTSLASNVVTVNVDVLDQLLPGMRFRVINANAGTTTPTQFRDCYFTVVSTTAFSTGSATATATVQAPHGCSAFATQALGLSLFLPLDW
ncbi:hypothetical protein DYB31_002620, partial [Aphanomyces astaci]